MIIKLTEEESKILLQDLLDYKERVEELLSEESEEDPFNNIDGNKKSIEIYSSIINQIRTNKNERKVIWVSHNSKQHLAIYSNKF